MRKKWRLDVKRKGSTQKRLRLSIGKRVQDEESEDGGMEKTSFFETFTPKNPYLWRGKTEHCIVAKKKKEKKKKNEKKIDVATNRRRGETEMGSWRLWGQGLGGCPSSRVRHRTRGGEDLFSPLDSF